MRLGQVLINLTSNAIKFTHSGGKVTVNLKLKEEIDSSIIMCCSVQDTGIGLTSEELDKLFKPFTQTDTSITRKYGGTGLGLVISHNLIQKMGGKVWVESTKKIGSTFYFTAQFKKVKDDALIDENSHISDQVDMAKSILENTRILLVEDNKVNQLVAKKLLVLNKMEVEIANNGQEAIDLTVKRDFDGILMDCMMPVMDGYTATEEIRKNPDFSSLPIIAMTANVMKQDIKKAINSGMNDHIAKPINPDTMLITMARWIRNSAN